MIEIDDALAYCNRACGPLRVERRELIAAPGCYLAADLVSGSDLPPFPQSAMDGWAVRAADLTKATDDRPVTLRRARDSLAAGTQSVWPELSAGEAMRVFTGAVVPKGADAVVRQEVVAERQDGVRFAAPVAVGNNVRSAGEEMCSGDLLMSAGVRLTAGRLGAIAAAGHDRVAVYSPARVRVLITGDEVMPPGVTLPLGAVHDANGPILRSLFSAWGCPGVMVDYVRDDWRALATALENAFHEGDLVVTAGGVSVGERDLVIPVAESLGTRRVFWRVRQKPGKPLYFGMWDERVPVLGLPGNPAAVLVGALIYGQRLLGLLQGAASLLPHWYTGVPEAAFPRDERRDGWIRGCWRTDQNGCVRLSPLPRQASHMLSNLSDTNALVRVPAGSGEWPVDAPLAWLPMS